MTMTVPAYLKRLLGTDKVKRTREWEGFAASLDTGKILVTLLGGTGPRGSYGTHLLERLKRRFSEKIEALDIQARHGEGLLECLDAGPAPDVRFFRAGREMGRLTGIWPEQEYVRVLEEAM